MPNDVVAFIPARAGSKGVPGKNKRIVAGKPLIQYSIEAARDASAVSRIIVSTDDEDILQIATACGAETVARPSDIAGDESPVIDAVRHALGSSMPLAVVLLQPTSPLRSAADIDATVGLYLEHGAPVCSVYRVDDAHPARMYGIVADRLVPLMPELAAIRRQDLPAVYHRNGAIYVFGPAEIDSGAIIGPDMMPYVMSHESSVNVDTELDLYLLEAVMRSAA